MNIKINYIYQGEISSIITNQENGYWYTTLTY
jgi:hypothetical protein